MIVSIFELFDMFVMTFAVGYIFMDVFRQFRVGGSILYNVGFNWRNFWLACLVTAPALIVHELFHKFVALAFGLSAVFHTAYFWLGFGVLLKFLNSPFLFFVPAFVSIDCVSSACADLSQLDFSLVAFAGPFANLLLFFLSRFLLQRKHLIMKWRVVLFVSKQINLFLFIFNMLPFPGFDGWKVYHGLYYAVKALL